MGPYIDDLVGTLGVGDDTHLILLLNFIHFLVGFGDQLCLLFRNEHIAQVEGKTAHESHTEAHAHHIIQELGRSGVATFVQHTTDDVTQSLLGEKLVDITIVFRNHLIEQYTTHGRFGQHHLAITFEVDAAFDGSVEVDLLFIISNNHLFGRVEAHALARNLHILGGFERFGDVVQTKNHVL